MKTGIIVDIDGTLANCAHRRHFVAGQGKRKNWKAFFENAHLDTPNKWCKELVLQMDQGGHWIVLVTGREETMREVTEKWLSQHQIPWDRLIMRPAGDYRQDCVVKQEIYEQKIKPEFKILFCVDDRQQVVNMWRTVGLTCLQCDEGDF